MTKIFADGISLDAISLYEKNPLIEGFTTNPTLIRKLGVTNYLDYIKKFLEIVPSKSVSVEILTTEDDDSIYREARLLASLGKNACIKIPITDTKGRPLGEAISNLASDGYPINITAITTKKQIELACEWLKLSENSYISIFAGRIADTGVNPKDFIEYALKLTSEKESLQVIWASPREIFNFVQAQELNCDVITMTADLIEKLKLFGKDLEEYSLETVQMFDRDAQASRFVI